MIAKHPVKDQETFLKQIRDKIQIPELKDYLAKTLFRDIEDLPYSHLYIPELIQNALDVNAKKIKIIVFSKDTRVIFEHDGERTLLLGRFSLSDAFQAFETQHVESISSLFSSSKSDDLKSVGFMGFGFKTLFKRFSYVDFLWKG
jgi:hypothetical protein